MPHVPCALIMPSPQESGAGMRNCQSFSADLFGFLVSKKRVDCYHPVCNTFYKARQHRFLYDPDLSHAPVLEEH